MELVNPFNEQYFALFGNTEHDKNEIGWKTKDLVLKNNEPNVDCSKSDINLLQSHTIHDVSGYSKKIEEGILYQSFLSDSVKKQKKTVSPNQAQKFNEQFKRSLEVHESDCYADKYQFSQSSPATVIKKKQQQTEVSNSPSFQQKSYLGLGFSDHRNQYEPFYLCDMSINQQYHYKTEVCQGVYTKPVFSSVNSQSCNPLQTQMHKSYSSGAFKNIEPSFHGFIPLPTNDFNSYNSYLPYIGSLSDKYKASSPLSTLDNGSYIDDFNRSTTVEHLPSIAKLNAKRSHQEYQADLNTMRYNFYEQNQTNIDKSSSISKPAHFYPNENKPIHHYSNEVSAGLFSSNVQIPLMAQQLQRNLNSNRTYDQQTCFYYNTPVAHIPTPTYGTPCYSNASALPADLENQIVYDSLVQELWQGNKSNLIKNHPTQNTIFSNQNGLEENYCLIPSSSLFKENLHPLNNTCIFYQTSSVKSYTSSISASGLHGQPNVSSSYLQHSRDLENMSRYYTHQTISGTSAPLTVTNAGTVLSVSSLESSKFNKQIPSENLSEYEQTINQQPTESMQLQPKLYSLRGKGLQSVQSSLVKREKKTYAKKTKTKNSCMLSTFQHNFPPSYLSIGKVKGIVGLRSSSCNNSSVKNGYKCTQCVNHNENDDTRSCIHIEKQKINKANPSSKHNMGLRKRAYEEESLKNLTVNTSLDSQKCDLKSAYKESYANQDKRHLLLQTSQTKNNINKKVASSDSSPDTDGFLSPISMKSFEECEKNTPSSEKMSLLFDMHSKNSSQFSLNCFQNANGKDSFFSHSIDMQKHAKLMSNTCKQKFSFVKKKRTRKQDSYEKVCLYLSTLKKEQNQECSPNNVAGIITAQLELCIKLNLPIEINQIVRRRNLLKRSKVQSFKRIFIEIFLNSYKKIHNTAHGRKQLEPKKRLANKT